MRIGLQRSGQSYLMTNQTDDTSVKRIWRSTKCTGRPIIYDTITKCNINFTYHQQIVFIYVLNCSWIIEIYVKKLITGKCIILLHIMTSFIIYIKEESAVSKKL